MNLVKWLRKNNRKVMAVVVVLIMISFVLGAALQQLARRMGQTPDKAIYKLQNGEISSLDINFAETELAILKALNQPIGLLGLNQQGQVTQRNIGWLLLNQMLFPDISRSLNISNTVKMLARQNQLGVSETEIDDFFTQASINPQINWMLLKHEAKKYGITVTASQTEEMVKMQNAGSRIATLAKNSQMTSEQVYQALADFEEVRMLVGLMTTADNTTISQVKNLISATRETFDQEYVRFSADMFVDQIDQPSEEEIQTHFEKFKNIVPGEISDGNPFGFGYKLPDRVKIEYALVDLEQVEKLIEEVTEEQAEQFYQQNLDRLTRQVPMDPNDPNSPMTTHTMRYSQVANAIKMQIKQNRINAKAEEIISSIKETAAASYGTLKPGEDDAVAIKEAASPYTEIAEQAKQKYPIEIDTGTTSYVSAVDLGSSSVLGNMALVRGQSSAVSLIRLVFAIEQLSEAELYDVKKPALYENIGTVRDGSGQKVGVVRVIDYKKAASPESLDMQVLRDMPLKADAEVENFTIREKVVENIKLAKAFEIAVEKANQFLASVKDVNDWDATIENFNDDLGLTDSNETQLSLETMNRRSRIMQSDIEAAKAMSSGQSFAGAYQKQMQMYKSLFDDIYNLGENDLPTVIEVKADGGAYVIKSVDISKLNIDEYNQAKLQMALALDDRASQVGALVYLHPENLKQRLNFEIAQKEDETDANDVNDANTAGK